MSDCASVSSRPAHEQAAASRERLPVANLLALATAGFITILTEALPAGGFAGDDQRGRFYVTLAPRSAKPDAQGNAGQRDTEHIDIEMQFAALAPPEAIMRVIDEYTHRLVPRARHGNEEHRDGEPA
ncbi:DUF2589 domain-containing protein [Paraburkholderia sp. Se-20369]|nr:DUF2589 domain-containing protein [Paraburkholderia sp. Se-20369]